MTVRFPEITEYSEPALNGLGYIPLSISVFERALTEDEAATNDIITYADAAGTESYFKYMEGEERFIRFYDKLFSEEVCLDIVYNPISESMEALPLSMLSAGTRIMLSLREMGRMDLYLERSGIRIIGGFDRTDLVLVKNTKDSERVVSLATDCGLYVIS